MEEAERFYEWLLKIKNIYLADNQKMCEAYDKIFENAKIETNANN
jgi:hypothetical protein